MGKQTGGKGEKRLREKNCDSKQQIICVWACLKTEAWKKGGGEVMAKNREEGGNTAKSEQRE